MGEFGVVINDLSKVGGISAIGLLLLFLWMFATGRIRPQKHLDEFREMNNKILEHKDAEIVWWRHAYETQSQRSDRQEKALNETLDVGRATLQLMQSASQL